MFWLNVKRIIRSGFVSFWRNGVVSLSAILVMLITLLIISGVFLSNALLEHTLKSLKDSVDINVNILTSVIEEDVLKLKSQLENLPEVENVEYVSAINALEKYKERHKDDQKILSALEELNENPLGAILNIKAKQPSQYENIQIFLEQNYPIGEKDSIVEKVNYARKKDAIDRLNSIINASEKFGIIVMSIFVVLSILITLNTIRLIMFISKDEIKIMNLVGAGHYYIKGPFVVAGAMYGIFSAILVLIMLYPITYYITPIVSKIFFNMDIFSYFLSNFGEMFLIIITSGIGLGAISSFFAISRYLKDR